MAVEQSSREQCSRRGERWKSAIKEWPILRLYVKQSGSLAMWPTCANLLIFAPVLSALLSSYIKHGKGILYITVDGMWNKRGCAIITKYVLLLPLENVLQRKSKVNALGWSSQTSLCNAYARECTAMISREKNSTAAQTYIPEVNV